MYKIIEIETKCIISQIKDLPLDEKVDCINFIREELHNVSPFKSEPTDFVKWVKNDKVGANDYNPNTVAPPEMELLRLSIASDGYTQPIVTWSNSEKIDHEVIDGFHRHRVGKECDDIQSRVHGYLPIVTVSEDRESKNDRMASTVRHNRARGKHKVNAMSDMVMELKNRNWTNKRICKELGMDEDEVLRLCQITGLQDLFKDDDFSKSWDVADSEVDSFVELTDEVTEFEKEFLEFRTTVNTSYDRIMHTFDKWECHKAGFYGTKVKGMTKAQCEDEFADLIRSDDFELALNGVITEWKYSCEHYLTNKASNRIAWLGQAAVCYARGIPAKFRAGWFKLTEEEQIKADNIALKYLNIWLDNNGRDMVSLEEAKPERQVELY
jgi:hypothetical protein